MSAITLTVDDRCVATVVVDHPPINLMTTDVFVELAKLTSALAVDRGVRVVVLRSANPEFFIAHFDVEAILGFPTDTPPPSELPGFHRMCETLRTMPKPTIAVIEGRVGGGGNEVAMSCDMRFATQQAVFNQPEVALGIIPGGTGTVRLPRLVGRGRALEIILGCDDIDAATAEQWGMINRVLRATEIDLFVDRLAGRIASFPRDAVAAAKASVVRADQELGDDLLAEATAFSSLLGNADSRDAMTAFLAHGGQTPEGERRLGDLAGEISG
jgi:enoyl-CoA hydratase/carnithine racemase